MFVSDECTVQQGGFAMVIDDPQPSVIWWQQAWWEAGARQAKPGSTAHNATIASMNRAPLLPTRTVYTCLRIKYAVCVSELTVIRITC
jgi:hypothetical protein